MTHGDQTGSPGRKSDLQFRQLGELVFDERFPDIARTLVAARGQHSPHLGEAHATGATVRDEGELFENLRREVAPARDARLARKQADALVVADG